MAPKQADEGKIPFDVFVPNAPVTRSRFPATTIDKFIDRPSLPRANRAVSAHLPGRNDEYASKSKDSSVLQQHVAFWDRNGDGQIYPWHTYVGFRELGFNPIFSLIAMAIIHLGFSYPTRLGYSWIPDPWFRVYAGTIHKAKHGSDSGTYDSEGRFRPQQFEDMFAKYDKDQDGALSGRELFDMTRGNRNVADPFGWGAAVFEFGTTWLLIQKYGVCSKEDLRGIYDGSIFFRIRAERAKDKGWNQGYGFGDFFGRSKIRWADVYRRDHLPLLVGDD